MQKYVEIFHAVRTVFRVYNDDVRPVEAKPPATEERYQAFIRNSSEGIWRFELDEPIPIDMPARQQVRLIFERAYLAEANQAVARMYGFASIDEMVGMRLPRFMDKHDPENIAYIEAFVKSGYKLNDVESHEFDKFGNDKYFRNSMVGFVENGFVTHAWGTQQDVTDRRAAEIALRRSEERLSLALQGSSMGLWEWDIENNQLYWSDELKHLFGQKSDAKITYEKYRTLIHPDDRPKAMKVIQQSMRTGDMYQFEHRVVWPDGSVHWLLGRGRSHLENGKAVRMIGTCINIDESKQAEAEAWRQNRFLELLHKTALEANLRIGQPQEVFQSILDHACMICDADQGFIYLLTDTPDQLIVKVAKGMFEQFKGHTIKKGEGLSGMIWETGKPVMLDDYDAWPGRLRSFPKGLMHATVGVPLQIGGDFIGVLALSYEEKDRQFDAEQLGVLLRLTDLASITLSNTRLLAELQESEQRFRSLADTAPVLIWIAGPDKLFSYFNKPWLEFTGRTMEQELGTGWTKGVHADDLSKYQQSYEAAFIERKPFSMEYRLRRNDGAYRWVVDKGIPRFSPAGDFQGYIGTCIDIDEMKQANELVLANTKLKNQQAQLLAVNRTKDEFIALASHQLRTPATAVKQYTSLLMQEFAGPITAEQHKYLQVAYDSNERQLQIINDLLKTAQIDSSRYVLEKEPQDIAKIIRNAAREVQTTFELRNQRVILTGVKKCLADVDANEFKLVLVNLLENASKYSYPDSDIGMALRVLDKKIEVSVTDSGVGIKKSDSARIFDKFTRVDNELSDTVSGTGFGLYWVKRIIGLHGGTIKVESEVGKGSKFVIRLPK